MNERILPLICHPETHQDLELQGASLVNPRTGKRDPLRDGVPDFLESVTGQNKTTVQGPPAR